jgi:AraC family transcriptional regulator of adaptative response / DNA-3-methyladenine glycosylase II
LTVRLALRQPFDAAGLLRWLGARAVPGVEEARGGAYRRTVGLPGGVGIVALEPCEDHVRATFRLTSIADLAAAVNRCRRLLDLDADPQMHAAVIGADQTLAPLLAENPGLRTPGAVDGAESAIRTVLGQQVSLAAARTFGARLVAAHGTPLAEPDGSITHAFPEPHVVAEAGLEGIGLTRSRRETVRELARRIATGKLVLDGGADRAEVQRRLLEIPGVGRWTADYVSLRALGDPDAFPAGDAGLRRAARRLGLPGSVAALAARSQRWRPWRAYAAHYLWAVDA